MRRLHPVAALLVALLAVGLAGPGATAQAAKAKYPSVKKVSPLKLGVGDTLVLTGKHFRKGKGKNTVVFRRDGGRAIFVRAGKATSKRLSVVVPAKLLPYMAQRSGKPVSTRFRVRVLTKRLAKRYTARSASPVIDPVASRTPGATAADCDGDGIPNTKDADDDDDLLPDTEELSLQTNACARDTDGDGMSDGWEQISAQDRNGKAKPAPRGRPYPNALNGGDGQVDHDGDGLVNVEEYAAWATSSGGKLRPDVASDPLFSRLTYSGGSPASDGRVRVPATPATYDGRFYMDRDANGYLSDLERDADGDRIPNLDEEHRTAGGGNETARGPAAIDLGTVYDVGIFTSLYVKEFATKLSTDKVLCGGVNQVPFYCFESYQPPIDVQKVDTLDWLSADSDGDGVRDDVDDVDHDDVPNIDEYLAYLAAAPADRAFQPLDACKPSTDGRFCLLATVDIDKDGLANRDDDDDDGDGLSDADEARIKTDPLRADTDGDRIDDRFEYVSAKDLNEANRPYPGKRPYPNPLDASDGDLDFDQDGLTMRDEHKAWNYTGRPVPLTYSDGEQRTGGGLRDDLKDVDGDGARNFDEAHGALSGAAWWDAWTGQESVKCHADYVETRYPGPDYGGLDFVDPDTDGDGVKDGADDLDHDGYSNAVESVRRADWCARYVSTAHTGAEDGGTPDPDARVQPFNPCKPVYSDHCHANPPFGVYKDGEDWASPVVTSTGSGPGGGA